jgi:hypothetical protein
MRLELDYRLTIALHVVLILLIISLKLLRCLRAEHDCLHDLVVALFKCDCACVV